MPKIAHTIKFSEETNAVLENMRKDPKHKRKFNQMVEFLVENNPEFVAFQKKLQQKNRSKS